MLEGKKSPLQRYTPETSEGLTAVRAFAQLSVFPVLSAHGKQRSQIEMLAIPNFFSQIYETSNVMSQTKKRLEILWKIH